MSNTNPKVDGIIKKAKQWREATETARSIILELPLIEELKWGKPCYSHDGNNIVLIQGFKAYFALLFFNGALLKDPKGLLVKTGENTQVGRQMRFTSAAEITKSAPALRSYLKEAIENAKAGLKVTTKATSEFEFPDELQKKLKENAALKKAFTALTPGRQRGYLIHFAGAKQSKTREARIDKCTPMILKGKGLNDD